MGQNQTMLQQMCDKREWMEQFQEEKVPASHSVSRTTSSQDNGYAYSLKCVLSIRVVSFQTHARLLSCVEMHANRIHTHTHTKRVLCLWLCSLVSFAFMYFLNHLGREKRMMLKKKVSYPVIFFLNIWEVRGKEIHREVLYLYEMVPEIGAHRL